MADVKFSQFSNIPVLNGSEQIVGYVDDTNIRMDVDAAKDYIDKSVQGLPGLDKDTISGVDNFKVFDGSAQQMKKVSVGAIRDYIIASKGYSSVFLNIDTANETVTVVGPNDFAGATFTYSNPANGVVKVISSSAIFTVGKTFVMTSGCVADGGAPFFIANGVSTATYITTVLYKFDGTVTATPFVIFHIEIRVYQ